jgi:DNA-binding NtrC family response regulator
LGFRLVTQPARDFVVDDEACIRDSLAEFPTDHDCQVAAADRAEAALVLLGRTVLDAAIGDLRLPGLGRDALFLNAHQIQPALRFLTHTGFVGYPSPETSGASTCCPSTCSSSRWMTCRYPFE